MTTPQPKTPVLAVIGAGGFVGARLITMAEVSGAATTIPILRSHRGLGRLGLVIERSLVVDTANLETLAAACKGADVVLNLTMGDESRTLEDTQRIYNACLRADVKQLIHISSAVVFGRVRDACIHDDSPPDVNSWMLYARGKAKAEVWLRQQMARKEIQTVVLRPGLIWGPGSNWSEMVGDQLAHGKAVLSNAGKGIANLDYLDNLVRVILAVAARSGGPSGFYNVGDAETVTWAEYYRGMATRLGYPAEAVHLWPDGKLRIKASHLVEKAIQNPMIFNVAKKAWKEWLGSGAKAAIKRTLIGSPQPPGDAPGEVEPPKLSRGHWVLLNTVHKLPVAKIQRDFGPIPLVPFTEALDVTAAWLNYAGFGNPAAISPFVKLSPAVV